jgi:hypothetical protein
MKILFVSISISLLISSCEKRVEIKETGKDKQARSYGGKPLNEIPKVALVESIYSVADTAIAQSWTKQVWIIRFGKPSSIESANANVEILNYRDSGPYQPPLAKYFLSRASIKLVNDKTVDVSYGHTELK